MSPDWSTIGGAGKPLGMMLVCEGCWEGVEGGRIMGWAATTAGSMWGSMWGGIAATESRLDELVPSMKAECDYLYGWTKKQSHTQKSYKNSEPQRSSWKHRRRISPNFKDRLIGLVVRIRLESGRSLVQILLAPGFFRGRVIPVTSKLALQWLPCQAPGVTGSALGLVGPVSVYCDWVR